MRTIEISDNEIMECETAKEAMKMSLERSGRSLFVVASECGITESHLSRCLNKNDAINLPHQKVVQFMTSCGNAIYLRWLYLSTKNLMPDIDDDITGRILSEVESLKGLVIDLTEEIKSKSPPKLNLDCDAHFALRYDVDIVPRWLAAEADLIERELILANSVGVAKGA